MHIIWHLLKWTKIRWTESYREHICVYIARVLTLKSKGKKGGFEEKRKNKDCGRYFRTFFFLNTQQTHRQMVG